MGEKTVIANEKDPLTQNIIACAYDVHSKIGPGFNERVYHNALKVSLNKKYIKYETEKQYKVCYEGEKIGFFKIDLLVENKVIVEVKAIVGIMPKLFESQVLSYLKISSCSVGLLINFGNTSCQVRRLMVRH